MNREKIKKIAYWVTTGFVVANYAFGGFMYITLPKDVVDGMGHLGYPLYFAVMLGVWKLLGSIAIAVPRFPRVKEWAYAGMVFNLVGAAISNNMVGNGIGDVFAPLILLVLVVASWALRPASRKL